MGRRTILAIVGTALSTPIIGCLDRRSDGGVDDEVTDTDGGDADETGENGVGDTDDQSADDTEYTYDESRRDSVFIENTTDEETVVELRLERKSDGETLVENAYDVPPKTGLEIPDVADVGEEYAITATHDGVTEEFEWTVLTCAHEEGPEVGGETAIGVEITADELRIGHTGCDEDGAGGNRELTYEDHEGYARDA